VVSLHADAMGERWQCLVAIETAGRHTGYTVTVTKGDLERWGTGTRPKDIIDLVVRSFEFLLEREPATSIFRSFELSAIPRHFPEYNQLFQQA
jgi:hypothetical protein